MREVIVLEGCLLRRVPEPLVAAKVFCLLQGFARQSLGSLTPVLLSSLYSSAILYNIQLRTRRNIKSIASAELFYNNKGIAATQACLPTLLPKEFIFTSFYLI